MSDVRFEERPISVEELRRLAAAVGWLDHYDWPSIDAGLASSEHSVVAVTDTDVVGCGRVVGDGVAYFYLQDVLVSPDHEGEGIATQIVRRLLDRIADTAPADAFVGLFASPDAVGVYEELGFMRPEDMTAMHRTVTASGSGRGPEVRP